MSNKIDMSEPKPWTVFLKVCPTEWYFHLMFVDLKLIDRQIFLQQRWVYWELEFRICSQGKPHAGREGDPALLHTEEKEIRRAVGKKESTAFHWLNPCQEGRGVFLLLLGWASAVGCQGFPCWSPSSAYLTFLFINFLMCSFGEWLHGLKSVGDFASYNGFRKTHVVYLLVKWSNQKKQIEGQFILTQYVSNLYDHFWVGVICSTCVLIMLHRTYFSETMPQTFPGYTGNFPFIYLSLPSLSLPSWFLSPIYVFYTSMQEGFFFFFKQHEFKHIYWRQKVE